MFPVVLMVLGAGAACGQNYPGKPVRIVTTVTGGSQDLTARLIAPKLAERLSQQVIVDNRGSSFPAFPGSDLRNVLMSKNKALNTTGIERLEPRF